MPKLALLMEYPTLHGGEYSMLATLPGLIAAGWEPVAICPAEGPLADALRRRNVSLCEGPPPASEVSQSRRREVLADLLTEIKPDLLHANSLSMGRLAGPVAQEAKVAAMSHLRDMLRLSRSAIADLNRCQRLLAVSHATRQYHVDQGLNPDKTFVLYNGVDLDAFSPREPTGWLHEELGIDPQAILLGAIGQLIVRKGQDLLLETLADVFRREPLAHLVIVGARFSQKPEAIEYEQRLHRFVAQEPLAGRCHFLGVRNDVPAILCELYALLHFARQDPLCRVLLEAAACGVPVVASCVGGSPEIFPPLEPVDSCKSDPSPNSPDRRESGGILFPLEDLPAAAETICGLLESPNHRAQLSLKIRQRALAFSAEQAVLGLIDHYPACLQ